MPTEFTFDENRRGEVAELTLAGDLDMQATFRLEPALERLLDAGDVDELVLDLSDVSFVDSSGLGLLLGAYDRCVESETEMAIVPGAPEVQRVFALAGVQDALPFRDPSSE